MSRETGCLPLLRAQPFSENSCDSVLLFVPCVLVIRIIFNRADSGPFASTDNTTGTYKLRRVQCIVVRSRRVKAADLYLCRLMDKFIVAHIYPDMTDAVSALSEEKQIARTEILVSVRDIDLLPCDTLVIHYFF